MRNIEYFAQSRDEGRNCRRYILNSQMLATSKLGIYEITSLSHDSSSMLHGVGAGPAPVLCCQPEWGVGTAWGPGASRLPQLPRRSAVRALHARGARPDGGSPLRWPLKPCVQLRCNRRQPLHCGSGRGGWRSVSPSICNETNNTDKM